MQEYKIDGLKEMMEALRGLPLKIQADLIRSFFRKAASKFVIPNVRSALPYSKKTENRIVVQNLKEDRTAVYAGPMYEVFWLRFADKGTAVRSTAKGANRGAVVGHFRIEDTVDQQIDPITEYMVTNIDDEINTFLEKKIKKVNKKLGR